jgi:hypothetical protein
VTDIQKTLDTLAREINTEHTACESAANAAVTHAMRAGGLLTEVKGRLSHGEWGPWLVKISPEDLDKALAKDLR